MEAGAEVYSGIATDLDLYGMGTTLEHVEVYAAPEKTGVRSKHVNR